MNKSLISQNFLTATTVESLSTQEILNLLKEYKFVCIRGLISPESVQISRQALRKNFNRNNDHPTLGESPDQVKTNFQKLSVGGVHSHHHRGGYARLVRTFYNPLWTEDIYRMQDSFRVLITLRNKLINKPENFALDRVEEGLWTAARIHHYPTGGGFMQAHRDQTLANISREANLNYFQVMLIMSEKNLDFQEGGGFIEDRGERFLFEENCQLGDVVIYDSQTLHGVADIDPHHLLNLEELTGRLAAFVSLYKHLEKKS